MRVLLIEDAVRLAKVIELELMDAGHQVCTVHDGVNGLQQALDTPTDLILLDWSLPGVTGLEICTQLRAINNQTPIVFLTAYDDQEHRSQAIAAGADEYLVKPFPMKTLMAVMEQSTRPQPWKASPDIAVAPASP